MPESPVPAVAGLAKRRPVTLRTKLIGVSLMLMLLVCSVVGVATQLFLSHYLTQQVDQRLNIGSVEHQGIGEPGGSATDQSDQIPGGAAAPNFAQVCDPTFSTSIPSRARPGFTSTLTAVVTNGVVTSAGIYNGTTCEVLSATANQSLLAASNTTTAQTVYVDGFGDFRVLAKKGSDGDTVITGLPLDRESATLSRLVWTMIIVMSAGLALATAAAFFIVRATLRPLDRVAATARQVSTVQLDRGAVDLAIRVPEQDTDPRTEVGQVGAALNQMLGHVSSALERRQESEMQVRRFVADASHELRTPLAAIRGYAELARRDETDVATVSHALSRVKSESDRMSILVDDLLLLARLDAGRPLAQEEVDLTLLVMDVVGDARAAGPNHRWRLDLPEVPVTVTGDKSRLHQVLANLLTNARTHTPSGTTVTAGLAVASTDVVITVTDDGPGIEKSLLPGIFGRFVRGDSSRSRIAGSTGLGLAIVRAVVTAHHGTVTADSKPGSTVFTVRLPNAPHVPA